MDLYSPIPLEQAYSLYVAQQVFGITPATAGTAVYVPGRNAVPFLTRSNVDRTILRSIWNVADPQNVGTLSSMKQFQLLLRLVSMAQAGIIQSHHSVQDMTGLVQQYSVQIFPLPSFMNVTMPPQDQLMTMYGQFVVHTSFGTTAASGTTSIDDAFGNIVDVQDAPLSALVDNSTSFVNTTATTAPPVTTNSLPPPEPPVPSGVFEHRTSQISTTSSLSDTSYGGAGGTNIGMMAPNYQQQQRTHQSFVGTNAAPTTAPTSISDMFSDLGPTNNAPLPTLGSVGSTEAMSADSTTGTGSFEAPPTASTMASTAFNTDTSTNVASSMGELLGNPLQHQGATVGSNNDSNIDDEFGGFEDAPSLSASMPAEPIPSMTTSIGPSSGSGIDASVSFGVTSTSLPSMDISDAFGDVPVQDAPLPSLGSFGGGIGGDSNTIPASAPSDDTDIPAAIGVATASDNNDDDDDEFGDFGSAPQPSVVSGGGSWINNDASSQKSGSLLQEQQPRPFMSDTARAFSEPFGATQPASLVDAGRSLSISDAFGDMAPVENARIPPLDPFAIKTNPSSQDDNDDFGGFTTADTALVEPDDDFGDFGSASGSTIPPPTNIAPASQGQDLFSFGNENSVPGVADIGRTMSEPISASIPKPTGVADTARSLSIDDAFGSMSVSKDKPLPSLDTRGIQIATLQSQEIGPTPVSAEEEQNDDFGAAPTTAAEEFTFMGMDLGRTFSEPTTSISAPVETSASEVGRSLSIDDAFGELAAIQDAPLPSLGSFDAKQLTEMDNLQKEMEEQDEDDDFGGFEEAPASLASNSLPDSSSAPGLVKSQQEDHFLSFHTSRPPTVSDIGRAQSEPYSPPPVAVTEAGRSLSIPDAFGDVPVSDNPLPTLDMLGGMIESKSPSLGQSEDKDFDEMGLTSPKKPDDEFGDFSSNSAEPTYSATNENDFMAFETAPSSTTIGHKDTKPSGHQVAGGEQSEASSLPPQGEADAHDQDEFGDFDGFSAQPSASSVNEDFGNLGPVPSQPTILDLQEQNDEFGNFELPPTDHSPSIDRDEFGTFGAAPATTSNQEQDKFGDFGVASAEPITPEVADKDTFEASTGAAVTSSATSAGDGDDDFGDFTAVEATAANDDDFGDFGDFSGFEQAPSTAIEEPDNKNDDWGSFENVSASEGKVPSLAQENTNVVGDDDVDEDWGDFEAVSEPTSPTTSTGAPPANETFTEEIQLRNRTQSLSMQVPESLLLKSGLSGEHVNLGEAFEVNIGTKSTMNPISRKRVDRCIQVLEVLSKDNSKLASTYWVQIFDVIKDELELAKGVLKEAKTLSDKDWKRVDKPLSTMLAGLAEYMRISRSIVACIGDVLLLDESAILTIDTWASTWCSLSILEKPLEIENQWKDIQKLVKGTSLMTNAVSLSEIRTRSISSQTSSSSTTPQSNNICTLTLQPIMLDQDKSTTRAEVSFQGKYFMACSANFLANRCPFFVVGEQV